MFDMPVETVIAAVASGADTPGAAVTPMGITPRDYQQAAMDRAFELWNEGSVGCIARLFTGAGKTILASITIGRWLAQGDEYRAIVMCHETQLVWQFAEEITDVLGIRPEIEMGEYVISPIRIPKITVASKMSLWSREEDGVVRQPRLEKFCNFQYKWLVVIDELHRYQASQKSFKHIVSWFRESPHCKTLGITATPERGDKKTLAVLTPDIAYDYRLYDVDGGRCGVSDGWAVPYDQRFVVVEGVDFKKIGEVAKDFNEGELEAELTTTKALASMIEPTIKLVGNRQTLIFCVTVAMAKMVAAYINALTEKGECNGLAESVDGSIAHSIRMDVYKRFEAESFQFLVVCGLCREGYNCPGIGAVAVFRPTKSRPLAEQMKGRGCRPLRGLVNESMTAEERVAKISGSAKPTCMIVDLVGITGMADCASTAQMLAEGKPDEVIDRANAAAMEIAANDPEATIDMGEQIRRAERELAEEARKKKAEEDAQELARARRRAAMEARVQFSSQKVNQGHGAHGANYKDSGKRITWSKKYKGKLWSEVPLGFLQWSCENIDAAFLREQCASELMRRGIAPKLWKGTQKPTRVAEASPF